MFNTIKSNGVKKCKAKRFLSPQPTALLPSLHKKDILMLGEAPKKFAYNFKYILNNHDRKLVSYLHKRKLGKTTIWKKLLKDVRSLNEYNSEHLNQKPWNEENLFRLIYERVKLRTKNQVYMAQSPKLRGVWLSPKVHCRINFQKDDLSHFTMSPLHFEKCDQTGKSSAVSWPELSPL